jgi:hypothetical protein
MLYCDNGWSLTGLEQSLRKQGRAREADEVSARLANTWTRADLKLTALRF